MDPVTGTTAGATGNLPTTKTDATTRLTSFEDKLRALPDVLTSGELFEVVHRHGRAFHVYGSGDHRLFIGMPARTGGTEAAS